VSDGTIAVAQMWAPSRHHTRIVCSELIAKVLANAVTVRGFQVSDYACAYFRIGSLS